MPEHFEMDLGGNQVAVASYIICYSMIFLLVNLIKAVGSFFVILKMLLLIMSVWVVLQKPISLFALIYSVILANCISGYYF